jgi:hypothetical protein
MASPAQLAITKLTDTAKHVLNQVRELEMRGPGMPG